MLKILLLIIQCLWLPSLFSQSQWEITFLHTLEPSINGHTSQLNLQGTSPLFDFHQINTFGFHYHAQLQTLPLQQTSLRHAGCFLSRLLSQKHSLRGTVFAQFDNLNPEDTEQLSTQWSTELQKTLFLPFSLSLKLRLKQSYWFHRFRISSNGTKEPRYQVKVSTTWLKTWALIEWETVITSALIYNDEWVPLLGISSSVAYVFSSRLKIGLFVSQAQSLFDPITRHSSFKKPFDPEFSQMGAMVKLGL